MRTLFTLFRVTPRNLQSSSALTTLLASIMAPNTPPGAEFTPIITPLPRSSYPASLQLTPADFKRMDETSDSSFYSSPRFVHHIDDNCIARLKSYYEQVIRNAVTESDNGSSAKGASVLDLCSSWTSHLPDALLPSHDSKPASEESPMRSCIGVGMNTKELSANKHLTSYITKDLNENPTLPEIPDGSIDVAICSVSIDYMTRPVELLSEVRRTLKDGAWMHCTFSNRCFPTKVVGKWLRMSEEERTRWIGGYFWADEGGWEHVEEVVLNRGGYDDPLYVVRARKVGGKQLEAKAEL